MDKTCAYIHSKRAVELVLLMFAGPHEETMVFNVADNADKNQELYVKPKYVKNLSPRYLPDLRELKLDRGYVEYDRVIAITLSAKDHPHQAVAAKALREQKCVVFEVPSAVICREAPLRKITYMPNQLLSTAYEAGAVFPPGFLARRFYPKGLLDPKGRGPTPPLFVALRSIQHQIERSLSSAKFQRADDREEAKRQNLPYEHVADRFTPPKVTHLGKDVDIGFIVAHEDSLVKADLQMDPLTFDKEKDKKACIYVPDLSAVAMMVSRASRMCITVLSDVVHPHEQEVADAIAGESVFAFDLPKAFNSPRCQVYMPRRFLPPGFMGGCVFGPGSLPESLFHYLFGDKLENINYQDLPVTPPVFVGIWEEFITPETFIYDEDTYMIYVTTHQPDPLDEENSPSEDEVPTLSNDETYYKQFFESMQRSHPNVAKMIADNLSKLKERLSLNHLKSIINETNLPKKKRKFFRKKMNSFKKHRKYIQNKENIALNPLALARARNTLAKAQNTFVAMGVHKNYNSSLNKINENQDLSESQWQDTACALPEKNSIPTKEKSVFLKDKPFWMTLEEKPKKDKFPIKQNTLKNDELDDSVKEELLSKYDTSCLKDKDLWLGLEYVTMEEKLKKTNQLPKEEYTLNMPKLDESAMEALLRKYDTSIFKDKNLRLGLENVTPEEKPTSKKPKLDDSVKEPLQPKGNTYFLKDQNRWLGLEYVTPEEKPKQQNQLSKERNTSKKPKLDDSVKEPLQPKGNTYFLKDQNRWLGLEYVTSEEKPKQKDQLPLEGNTLKKGELDDSVKEPLLPIYDTSIFKDKNLRLGLENVTPEEKPTSKKPKLDDSVKEPLQPKGNTYFLKDQNRWLGLEYVTPEEKPKQQNQLSKERNTSKKPKLDDSVKEPLQPKGNTYFLKDQNRWLGLEYVTSEEKPKQKDQLPLEGNTLKKGELDDSVKEPLLPIYDTSIFKDKNIRLGLENVTLEEKPKQQNQLPMERNTSKKAKLDDSVKEPLQPKGNTYFLKDQNRWLGLEYVTSEEKPKQKDQLPKERNTSKKVKLDDSVKEPLQPKGNTYFLKDQNRWLGLEYVTSEEKPKQKDQLPLKGTTLKMPPLYDLIKEPLLSKSGTYFPKSKQNGLGMYNLTSEEKPKQKDQLPKERNTLKKGELDDLLEEPLRSIYDTYIPNNKQTALAIYKLILEEKNLKTEGNTLKNGVSNVPIKEATLAKGSFLISLLNWHFQAYVDRVMEQIPKMKSIPKKTNDTNKKEPDGFNNSFAVPEKKDVTQTSYVPKCGCKQKNCICPFSDYVDHEWYVKNFGLPEEQELIAKQKASTNYEYNYQFLDVRTPSPTSTLSFNYDPTPMPQETAEQVKYKLIAQITRSVWERRLYEFFYEQLFDPNKSLPMEDMHKDMNRPRISKAHRKPQDCSHCGKVFK